MTPRVNWRAWSGLWALPLLLHGSTTAHAAELSCERPEVRAFSVSVETRHRIPSSETCALFAEAKLRADVLRLIAPAPVSRPPDWDRYRANFVNERRIRDGIGFWETHQVLLSQVAAQSGVPASVLVALIGVETHYGGNVGRHKTFDALATLAFEYPRRADFFRGELEALLVLAREQQLEVRDIRGSYAGALGMPQFMPSSWRAYAVDGDGDGQVDLWGSVADVVASIANFLLEHGWLRDQPAALRAQADDNIEVTGGIKPDTPLAQLATQGVRILGGQPDGTPGVLLRYGNADQAEYWVGLENFYVITRYNRSSFYAMSVWQLAEALREAGVGVAAGALASN